jgi:pyruvate-formate lyase-activating enzyme
MRGLLADVIPSSCVDGPGNRYVVFLQGCTFDCLACHNPHTICRRPTARSHWVDTESLVQEIAAVAPFLSGVTVSGGEATLQWEFVLELFRRLRAEPATRALDLLVDSNGDAEPFAWTRLADVMDGAMIDLKAIDPEVHRLLTGHGNERVLASIRQLDVLGRLAEVRLLLIPGVNDHEDHLAATAALLRGLRSQPDLRVLAFRHHGTREVARRFPEATSDDVHRAEELLRLGGVEPRAQASAAAAPTESR